MQKGVQEKHGHPQARLQQVMARVCAGGDELARASRARGEEVSQLGAEVGLLQRQMARRVGETRQSERATMETKERTRRRHFERGDATRHRWSNTET